MTTQQTLKCRLGCGRVDAEIGPGHCGNIATCSSEGVPVVAGRDVIITVPSTGEVRCIDPVAAVQGLTPSAFAGLRDVNETTEVQARVIPVEVPVEAPVFVPSVEPPAADQTYASRVAAAQKKARTHAKIAQAATNEPAHEQTPADTTGEVASGVVNEETKQA